MEENRGVAKALNCGLEHCLGEFVARMDSDDIAAPDRLQCRFSSANIKYTLCNQIYC